MSGFFSISMIAAVQSRLASKPATVETVSAAVAAVPVVRLETGDLLLAALLIALNLSAAFPIHAPSGHTCQCAV